MRLSIVIPTFRRHDVLARVLRRLEAQRTSPGTFEVIVVDDPREDDPVAVAAAVGERPYPAAQISRDAAGVSAARNAGWRAARTPLVLFLGDDILPEPGLVSAHLDAHERHPESTAGVLGNVRWADELRVTPFMRWLEEGIQFDYGRIRGEEAGWWHFYTSNVSVKRALIERAGGFDEGFPFGYEDLDIAKRMSQHGFRLYYEPEARAEHLHVTMPAEWERRMEHVGRAERAFLAKHPDADPYFHRLFSDAVAIPARGRLGRLAGVVPRHTPVLGRLVWASFDAGCRRALAPAFMRGWDEAGVPDAYEDPAAASSASGPGGPK